MVVAESVVSIHLSLVLVFCNHDTVTEDHDFRQLPFSKRMQQVLRNKQEATELFKDGNYAHATARYVRALALTGKFIDLSTEEKVEADSIQVNNHENMNLFSNRFDYVIRFPLMWW